MHMNKLPEFYPYILKDTYDLGFEQLSDESIGSLLSTLCASKINGKFLEIGTGTGLSTSWMLHGMSSSSTLVTVDNDLRLTEVAKKYLSSDHRVEFVTGNGESLIKELPDSSIDLIFADTWPGKYNHLEEALSLLKIGGLYIIDDMTPINSWPESHTQLALKLEKDLNSKNNFTFTKLNWSSGIMVGVKNA